MRKIRNTMPSSMRCFSPPCFWRDASARSFRVQALWQKESLHE